MMGAISTKYTRPGFSVPEAPDSRRPSNTYNNALNIVDILQILSRNKRILLIPTILITVTTYFGLEQLPPQYQAQARLLIQGADNPTNIAPISNGLSSSDEEATTSEQYIIASYSFLTEVVNELSLHSEVEFNPDLAAHHAHSDATNLDGQDLSRVVSALEKKIRVTKEKDSRVITVHVTSVDPWRAKSIANLLVDKYLERQIDGKLTSAGRVDSWLLARIKELREDVARAESAVEQFRQRSQLLQTGGSELLQRQISELSTLLLEARSQRISAVTRANSGADVLDNDLINKLRATESSLQRELAKLSRKYGYLHPNMIQLKTELDRLKKNIRVEVNKVTKGIANDATLALQREKKLESELAVLKNNLSSANVKEVKLRELEQESDATRQLLATFLTRQKEVQLQTDRAIHEADARIISYAGVPHSHSFPRVLPMTALTFVAALFLSLITVFIVEQFRTRKRSAANISNLTGLPVLSLIPERARSREPRKLIRQLKNSHFGESFRNLQDRLGLSGPQGRFSKGGAFVVTSTYPGDGKTSVVSCLAVTMAQSGKTVLVIDGDLRKPSLHEVFAVDAAEGLRSDFWTDLALQELAQPTRPSFGSGIVDVIPAYADGTQHPHQVLSSQAFAKLISQAKRNYDIVLVDSPPLRAVIDSVVISRVVGEVLYVAPWSSVSPREINSGLEQLDMERVAGLVMTKVNVRTHNLYAYGDTGRHRASMRKYYSGSRIDGLTT